MPYVSFDCVGQVTLSIEKNYITPGSSYTLEVSDRVLEIMRKYQDAGYIVIKSIEIGDEGEKIELVSTEPAAEKEIEEAFKVPGPTENIEKPKKKRK